MKINDATRTAAQRFTTRTNATLTRLMTDDEGMSTAEYSNVRETSPDEQTSPER